MPAARICSFLLVLTCGAIAAAQSEPAREFYARTNSYGFLVGYSNDSSRMLAGDSAQRKLVLIGGSYSRKLILRRWLNWQYDGEVLPVALDSDPVATSVITQTYTNPPRTVTTVNEGPTEFACIPASTTTTVGGITLTAVTTCSRRWVYGGGMSPIGFRWNFLPRRQLQPFLVGHGGFIQSVDAIPISDAGSFNFTYDAGAGFEWYRKRMQSVRFEARFHHISNKETAPRNPGIDAVLFVASYVFGR